MEDFAEFFDFGFELYVYTLFGDSDTLLENEVPVETFPVESKPSVKTNEAVLTRPETSTRFASLNSQEIDDIFSEGDSKRTKATTKFALKVFKGKY